PQGLNSRREVSVPPEKQRFLARKVKDAKACDERKLLIQLKNSMRVCTKRGEKNRKWMITSQIEAKSFCQRRNLNDGNGERVRACDAVPEG
ncbi:MAG: hypothetical protein ABSB88_22145, partial [Bryobacteraceae bacterium]